MRRSTISDQRILGRRDDLFKAGMAYRFHGNHDGICIRAFRLFDQVAAIVSRIPGVGINSDQIPDIRSQRGHRQVERCALNPPRVFQEGDLWMPGGQFGNDPDRLIGASAIHHCDVQIEILGLQQQPLNDPADIGGFIEAGDHRQYLEIKLHARPQTGRNKLLALNISTFRCHNRMD